MVLKKPYFSEKLKNKTLAGAAGLEPATNGFGDHYSTN